MAIQRAVFKTQYFPFSIINFPFAPQGRVGELKMENGKWKITRGQQVKLAEIKRSADCAIWRYGFFIPYRHISVFIRFLCAICD
jgi:hypothetical protein